MQTDPSGCEGSIFMKLCGCENETLAKHSEFIVFASSSFEPRPVNVFP